MERIDIDIPNPSEFNEIEINIDKEKENMKNEEKDQYQEQDQEDEIIPIDNIDRTRYNESLNIDTSLIKENNNNNNEKSEITNENENNNNKSKNEDNNLESSKCFHDLPLQLQSHQELKKRKSFEKSVDENLNIINIINKFANNLNPSEPFLFVEGGLNSVR